ncbi:MAG TPA: 3-isopropylmalate dehydratase small subunit [Candidatus Latescibacteria bacterium]|nr:3-isopropylmalate dehydratase small subunit [Candidatus Latescibacterota bacterium]HOT37173.1 3-isopropylmalate dehydratase small subunit [Candidatus Latescibacterota bacterium]HPC45193.1 3-isopropylmalate dehydratase small subunit [Candidatus Latescibacterota bacterium]HPK75821.1 3-isopropylmalate dehydratase small subunit [Candidatus Latescibacterota bacterium]HQI76112.1 3-isopropylmalate dehydratase small subunit [Candidatus Latescibacterota bacterium]
MRGRAHVYPRAHINTDEIIPARYLNVHSEAELAKHAMEDIDAEFVKRVQPGDIIVAGDDFGCGSSREHAVWALRGAKVSAVIANNFARIYFRNSINNGFPAIECQDIAQKVQTGDELEIDLKAGSITNVTRKETYTFVPMADFAVEIMQAGGLLEYVKAKA